MGIANLLRSYFGHRGKIPDPGPFPEIAVPLIKIIGNNVISSSNATIIDAEKGLLVTGKHCVVGADQVFIKTDGWHQASIIAIHSIDDMALIRVNARLTANVLKIRWAEKTSYGDIVSIKGWVVKNDENVEEFDEKIVTGKIYGDLRNSGWSVKSNLKKNDHTEGMSGSPTIDSHHELVGIYTSRDLSFDKKRELPTLNITPIWFVKNLF